MWKTDKTGQKIINPDSLIRNYMKIGFISMVTIIALTCYGTYRVYLAHVVAEAELSAVSLASSLMEIERENLVVISPEGKEELLVSSTAAPLLDRTMGLFFPNFNILKIKIFDRHAQVIYSNDRSIIGKNDPDNQRLKNALTGRNDSKVVKKDKILDFNGRNKFAVDVVETYIPVRDSKGVIIGSFELYQDVSRFKREIVNLVTLSGLILALILLSVFLISFLLLRRKAIQLKDVQAILKNQATIDFLTGIYNRRQLMTRCEEEMSRLGRINEGQQPKSLLVFILVDIDFFKKINDTYGHDAGDEVLRELALRLKNSIRQHDIIGRYGGEEFLIVLPDATQEQLRVIAERLWHCVRSAPINYKGESIAAAISLGVASTTGEEETHEQVISRADNALYRSKHAGRDRITYV